MGRQSAKIAFSSEISPSHRFFRMADNPTGSETILSPEVETAPTPDTVPTDPVSTFKKGRAKREAKRKEVQIIREYVPDPPAPTTSLSEAVEVPGPPPGLDVESIAGRVAEMVFAKMAVEKDEVAEKTPPNKTKPRPKAPSKKKESTPPPTKYFGWC